MTENITLADRLEAIESRVFGRVNLGDYSNDQDVPAWLAPYINTGAYEAFKQVQFNQAQIANAIQLLAQAKLTNDPKQADVLNRVIADIIDNWCGTKVPGRGPRPHWYAIIDEIGRISETFTAKSTLQEAAFDLSRRVLDRAQEVGRTRSLATV